jgi:hypothetical protein
VMLRQSLDSVCHEGMNTAPWRHEYSITLEVPSPLTCGLFVWVLRPAQEYFTYVTITDEGLQNLSLCSALRAFEQGGFSIVPHLLWHS